MRRGTTPIITFSVPFDTEDLEKCYITFVQDQGCRKYTVEKTIDDCDLDENTISVTLTQQETLDFIPSDVENVEIQMRVMYTDGTVDASNIIKTTFRRILKDGEI